MRLRPAILILLAFLLYGCQRPVEHPNIVFFLIDDLGWMDTVIYGSRYYETPNIDRLADMGMLLTNAYSASPHCSPTRASILTGKYPARLGITEAAGALPPLPPGASRYPETALARLQWLQPQSRRYLPLEELTIAEVLKEGGYRTAHLGKWHLGLPEEYWPQHQGFDVVFHGAPDPGPPSYFSPYGFLYGNIRDGRQGEYITDRLATEALNFIEANKDQPFLLHLWHYGVHGPWGYREDLRQPFVNRKDPRGKQDNSIMASMIKSVDMSVGRILDKLEELQILDRTVIFFFSDNGGAMHTWIGPDSVLPTNNSPLRGAKGTLYEGGIRVPLIISWPGVVEPGSRSSEVVSSVDFHPTILDMTGMSPRPQQILDGESLVPLLRQTGALKREAVFNYFPHGSIRSLPGVTAHTGHWKLIRRFGTSPWFPTELELYDLQSDLSERVNLAERMPERVESLNSLIDNFLSQTGALVPIPNPAYNATAAALGGWNPSGIHMEIKEGILRCALAEKPLGKWMGLAVQLLVHPAEKRQAGSYLLKVRARSERATSGRARLRPPGASAADGRVYAFDVAGDLEWQDIELRLEIDQAPVELLLEFLSAGSDVEIDSIQIVGLAEDAGSWPAFSKIMEWRFDL